MNRSPLCLLALAFVAPALFALDGPQLPIAPATGTPRTFTDTERTRITAYLKGLHERTANEFGSMMGFGLDRMEPLIYFHWFTPDIKTQFDVELIGRVKEQAPVVYTNPLPTAKGDKQLRKEQDVFLKTKITLPTAEQFKNAPSRALLPIEEAGMKALKKGETLYWEQVGDDVRVVGALTAQKTCAECHKTKENELLGAFTYRFTTERLLKTLRWLEEQEKQDLNNRQKQK